MPTTNVSAQLVSTTKELAWPRALKGNTSMTKNQGIEPEIDKVQQVFKVTIYSPGPEANEMTKRKTSAIMT